MYKVITLNGVIYNTKYIVSFRKYDNPVTDRMFIIIRFSCDIDGDKLHSNQLTIRYDNEDERRVDYKLLLDSFVLKDDWKNDTSSWSKVKI